MNSPEGSFSSFTNNTLDSSESPDSAPSVVTEVIDEEVKEGDIYTGEVGSTVTEQNPAVSEFEPHAPGLIKRIGAKTKAIFFATVEKTKDTAQKIGEKSQEIIEKAKQAIGKVKERISARMALNACLATILVTSTILSVQALSDSEAIGNNEDKNDNNFKNPYMYSAIGNRPLADGPNFDAVFDIAQVDFEREGYNKKGLWGSENKFGEYDFACAKEVAEVCNNDPKEMVKYVAHNQLPSLAAYIAFLPSEKQPEGFQGLSISQAKEKLEGLNDIEYAGVIRNFDHIIDSAQVGGKHVKGEYDNAYMDSGTSVVGCTTNEDREVAEFSWNDVEGTFVVKLGAVKEEEGTSGSGGGNGNGGGGGGGGGGETIVQPNDSDCTQAITPKGSASDIFYQVKFVEYVPTKKEKPTESPKPKNQAEADENSGASKGIVKPEKQEREITNEPVYNETHGYDSGTNTYNYSPREQTDSIGYEVTYGAGETGTGGGTTGGTVQANNFDADATFGTGEVDGGTLSADGSGNTIQYNLDNATGNTQANPAGDYSEGF